MLGNGWEMESFFTSQNEALILYWEWEAFQMFPTKTCNIFCYQLCCLRFLRTKIQNMWRAKDFASLLYTKDPSNIKCPICFLPKRKLY